MKEVDMYFKKRACGRWEPYLAMLLICDLCNSEQSRRKIYQKRVET